MISTKKIACQNEVIKMNYVLIKSLTIFLLAQKMYFLPKIKNNDTRFKYSLESIRRN
jgi:hypothetical protein